MIWQKKELVPGVSKSGIFTEYLGLAEMVMDDVSQIPATEWESHMFISDVTVFSKEKAESWPAQKRVGVFETHLHDLRVRLESNNYNLEGKWKSYKLFGSHFDGIRLLLQAPRKDLGYIHGKPIDTLYHQVARKVMPLEEKRLQEEEAREKRELRELKNGFAQNYGLKPTSE